jgi:hypothetical protein
MKGLNLLDQLKAKSLKKTGIDTTDPHQTVIKTQTAGAPDAPRFVSYSASEKAKLKIAMGFDHLIPKDLGLNWGSDLWHKLKFVIGVLRQYGLGQTFLQSQNLTVGELAEMAKDRSRFLALVEEAWDQIVEPIDLGRMQSYMDVFDPDPTDTRSLQTSRQRKKAYNWEGIAFRADTRGPENIFNEGFVAKYQLPPNLQDFLWWSQRLPLAVGGLKVTCGMFLNKVNRDFFNETGVCISRTLHGATKFPEPSYTKEQWLYAVKELRCYDTEAWQRGNKDKSSLWRPGEKVVPLVKPWNVVAAIKIQKKDYNADAAGKQPFFRYTIKTDWQKNNNSPWIRITSTASYLEKEIEGLKNKWIDFPREDDFEEAKVGKK